MKITISGPATASNANDDSEITDPLILRKCHGLQSDDSCIEFMDDAMADIGLIGGHLEAVFDETTQQLRMCTIYRLPKALSKGKLKQLVDDTWGQWIDGIGEGGLELAGENILVSAVFETRDAVSVEQIDDGVEVVKPRKSPLFAAVKKNDVAKIAKLLDAGENLEARDRHGSTPLLEAASEGQLEAACLLIERGANVNYVEKNGATATLHAATNGHTQILEALLKAGANPNVFRPNTIFGNLPLNMACNRKQFAAVQMLVEYGADVNGACDSGYTPLMHLGQNDVEIARFLVQHGADINAVNEVIEGQGVKQALKQALA